MLQRQERRRRRLAHRDALVRVPPRRWTETRRPVARHARTSCARVERCKRPRARGERPAPDVGGHSAARCCAERRCRRLGCCSAAGSQALVSGIVVPGLQRVASDAGEGVDCGARCRSGRREALHDTRVCGEESGRPHPQMQVTSSRQVLTALPAPRNERTVPSVGCSAHCRLHEEPSGQHPCGAPPRGRLRRRPLESPAEPSSHGHVMTAPS